MLDVKSITRKRDLLEPNEHGLEIHNRRDETIVGKKVEIGAGDACDNFYSCVFKDCEVRLRGPGRLIEVATRGQVFEDCHIWAGQKQNIATWEATFLRCRFRGTYTTRFAGPVNGCDFKNATLLSAAFLQDEPLGDTKWPAWPHVIIDSPTENYQNWKEVPTPSDFNRFLVWKTGTAAVINLEKATKDANEFWQRIQGLPYIHTHKNAEQ